MKQTQKLFILLGFVVILLVYFAIALGTMNPRVHNKFGAAQTQTVVMTAGKNFAESGFVSLKLTPRIANKHADWSSANDAAYTHFPPLPYYFSGLIWKLGGQSLIYYRLFNILVTGLFLAGAFMLFAQLFNPATALVAVVILTFQKMLYSISATAPEALSDMLAVWGLVLLLLAIKRESEIAKLLWIGSWILLFFSAYSSFEQIVATQIIASAIIWISSNQNRLRRIFILATAPVVAQALHFFINAWALGGIDKAYQDLTNAFLWRTLDIGKGTSYLQQIAGGPLGYPKWLIRRVADTYIGPQAILIIVVLLLLLTIMALRSKERLDYSNYARMVLVLAIAGISFWLMFPQLVAIQFSGLVGRHWILTHAILLGGGLYLMLREIWNHHHQSKIHAGFALLAVLLIGIILFRNVKQTIEFIDVAHHETWSKELVLLQNISIIVPDTGLLLTSQQPIAQSAFYHQPRESFGIGSFDIALVTTPNQLNNKIDSSCGSRTCFLLEVGGDQFEDEARPELLDSGESGTYGFTLVHKSESYNIYEHIEPMKHDMVE